MNKDSKGIAVFDTKGRRNTLKYYFDVSDTHEGYYGSRAVPIWQMDGRYEQAVTERLSDRFGEVESDSLAGVLMETARNTVEDNLQDYTAQLKDYTEGSFLEGRQGSNLRNHGAAQNSQKGGQIVRGCPCPQRHPQREIRSDTCR